MATAQLQPAGVDDGLTWLTEHIPDRYPLWVLELDGHIAGYLGFKPFLPRCAYRGMAELSVYVAEKFRGRGVAKRLLEEALMRAPHLGIENVVGLIFAHNQASLKLFEHFGFTRWGLLPRIARIEQTERDVVIVGRRCHAQNSGGTFSIPTDHDDVFQLMQTLMRYRHEPIHGELDRIRKKYSMLHLDVLLLIYHFARTCSGQILEIGAFLGGATIAAARGVRDAGANKVILAIEQGGSLKHARLGSRNILRDLERNLGRERVGDMVTLLHGRSSDPKIVGAVKQALGANQVGLLILDADAGKRRDIDCYGGHLRSGCWLVIDDYYGPTADSKIDIARQEVDEMVAAGLLEPLGFYGWSTWVGRWRGSGQKLRALAAERQR